MTVSRWIKYVVAVVLGNALYFWLAGRFLPPAARHQWNRVDVGIFVDLWFCLLVYGLLELTTLIWKRRNKG